MGRDSVFELEKLLEPLNFLFSEPLYIRPGFGPANGRTKRDDDDFDETVPFGSGSFSNVEKITGCVPSITNLPCVRSGERAEIVSQNSKQILCSLDERNHHATIVPNAPNAIALGYGSFRVDGMQEVKSMGELKRLMSARKNQISKAEGGTKKS